MIMTAIELKKVLIHRINEINDVSFLTAIKTILDSKSGPKVIALTEEQKNEINESRREVKQVHYIEHELLDKKVSEWLNTK